MNGQHNILVGDLGGQGQREQPDPVPATTSGSMCSGVKGSSAATVSGTWLPSGSVRSCRSRCSCRRGWSAWGTSATKG